MVAEGFSKGLVHGEGEREKKSKRDANSVQAVRVSQGSCRFVWLCKPSPLRGECFTLRRISASVKCYVTHLVL